MMRYDLDADWKGISGTPPTSTTASGIFWTADLAYGNVTIMKDERRRCFSNPVATSIGNSFFFVVIRERDPKNCP